MMLLQTGEISKASNSYQSSSKDRTDVCLHVSARASSTARRLTS